MMVGDLASNFKSTWTDDSLERGVEILSRTLGSIATRDERSKKGFTFGDLFIKVSICVILFETWELISISQYSAFVNIHCFSPSSTRAHLWSMILNVTSRSSRYWLL